MISYIKKILHDYLLLVACLTCALAIGGMVVYPGIKVDMSILLLPFIYAAISLFPSMVLYSTKELSKRNFIIRKIIQLIFIELLILIVVGTGNLNTVKNMYATALCILVVFVIFHLLQWTFDYRTALELSNSVKIFQEKRGKNNLDSIDT